MMAVVFQKSFQVIKTKSTLLQKMSMVADVKEKISDNNLILLFFFFLQITILVKYLKPSKIWNLKNVLDWFDAQ